MVDRSFPAFISRIDEDGPNIEIDSSFEEGSRRYRLAGERYCRECNKEKTLDREKRPAWTQRRRAEDRKIRLTQKSSWQRSEQKQRKRGGQMRPI